jgi:hypothetical protein
MGLRQEVAWGSGSLSKGWDEKSFFALFDKIEAGDKRFTPHPVKPRVLTQGAGFTFCLV